MFPSIYTGNCGTAVEDGNLKLKIAGSHSVRCNFNSITIIQFNYAFHQQLKLLIYSNKLKNVIK